MKKVKEIFYTIIFMFVVLFPLNSYAIGEKNVSPIITDKLYSYKRMEKELESLSIKHHNTLKLESIGKTFENKKIYLVKLSNKLINKNKPSVLAIFSQHPDEHDTTLLAMTLIKDLLKNKEENKILDEVDIFIVPMVNPDGVDFDLLNNTNGNFEWRKNRVKLGKNNFGVNLNRNWGGNWNAKISDDGSSKPELSNYKGEKPFSERETISLRDFIIKNNKIKFFLDYHSGISVFNQGMIIIPFTYTEDEKINKNVERLYKDIPNRFKTLIYDSSDKREDFIFIPLKDFPKYLASKFKEIVPPQHLKKALESLPKSVLTTGSSIDYVFGELGIFSLGIEISRQINFYEKYNENNDNFKNQIKGFRYILDYVKNKYSTK